jgi:hypothetical protein
MSGRTQKQLLQVGCHALVPGIKPAYGYVPSFAAGIVFCILFGLSFFGHVFRGVTKRRWTSYVLAAGAVTEIIGWAGRTASAKCPYSQSKLMHESRQTTLTNHKTLIYLSLRPDDFLMQITTLIIAPCFMSAAAYITLGALIRIVGRQSSLLSPRMYVIIFSSFDVISLVVQAIGGGSASVANQRGTSTKVGTDIMVAGILFQLATMIVFCCFLLDFVRRARGMEKPGSTRVVIYAMAFSILTIFIRSIYRSIELLQGWTGMFLRLS